MGPGSPERRYRMAGKRGETVNYDIYNSIAKKENGDYLFIQDGPLFQQPMVRDIQDLEPCERDPVQKMLGAEKND